MIGDPYSLRLDGAIILVTGAGGLIGTALATGLRGAGAIVVETDLVGDADRLAHDVTSPTDWSRIAAYIKAEHGRLDALIHNAGVVLVERFADMTIEAFRRVQAINVESIVIGTQAMLALLKIGGAIRPGGASIVTMSSVAGLRGAPMHAAYNASKGAVTLLTKSMANEFAGLGWPIRVNSLHPGSIAGPMMQTILDAFGAAHGLDADTMAQAAAQAQPLGRMGRAEELVGGVILLCSPAGSFMTGTELVIDGGGTSR